VKCLLLSFLGVVLGIILTLTISALQPTAQTSVSHVLLAPTRAGMVQPAAERALPARQEPSHRRWAPSRATAAEPVGFHGQLAPTAQLLVPVAVRARMHPLSLPRPVVHVAQAPFPLPLKRQPVIRAQQANFPVKSAPLDAKPVRLGPTPGQVPQPVKHAVQASTPPVVEQLFVVIVQRGASQS
jgi:hypothetical protein